MYSGFPLHFRLGFEALSSATCLNLAPSHTISVPPLPMSSFHTPSPFKNQSQRRGGLITGIHGAEVRADSAEGTARTDYRQDERAADRRPDTDRELQQTADRAQGQAPPRRYRLLLQKWLWGACLVRSPSPSNNATAAGADGMARRVSPGATRPHHTSPIQIQYKRRRVAGTPARWSIGTTCE